MRTIVDFFCDFALCGTWVKSERQPSAFFLVFGHFLTQFGGMEPVVDASPTPHTYPSRSSATTDGMSDRNECAILSRIRVPRRAWRRGRRGDASTGSARSSIQRPAISGLRGMRGRRARHRDARRQSGHMADDRRGCGRGRDCHPLLAQDLKPSAYQP